MNFQQFFDFGILSIGIYGLGYMVGRKNRRIKLIENGKCNVCENRKRVAHRTFLAHKLITRLPKGPNTGNIMNINGKTLVRWIGFRFVLGNFSSYWYKTAVEEGAKFDRQAKAKRQAARTRKTEVSGMSDGAGIGGGETTGSLRKM